MPVCALSLYQPGYYSIGPNAASGRVVDRLSSRCWNSPSSDSPLTVDSQETRSDRCQRVRRAHVTADVY